MLTGVPVIVIAGPFIMIEAPLPFVIVTPDIVHENRGSGRGLEHDAPSAPASLNNSMFPGRLNDVLSAVGGG